MQDPDRFFTPEAMVFLATAKQMVPEAVVVEAVDAVSECLAQRGADNAVAFLALACIVTDLMSQAVEKLDAIKQNAPVDGTTEAE